MGKQKKQKKQKRQKTSYYKHSNRRANSDTKPKSRTLSIQGDTDSSFIDPDWKPDLGRYIVENVTSNPHDLLRISPCVINMVAKDIEGRMVNFFLAVGSPSTLHMGTLITKQSVKEIKDLLKQNPSFIAECHVRPDKAYMTKTTLERVVPLYGKVKQMNFQATDSLPFEVATCLEDLQKKWSDQISPPSLDQNPNLVFIDYNTGESRDLSKDKSEWLLHYYWNAAIDENNLELLIDILHIQSPETPFERLQQAARECLKDSRKQISEHPFSIRSETRNAEDDPEYQAFRQRLEKEEKGELERLRTGSQQGFTIEKLTH